MSTLLQNRITEIIKQSIDEVIWCIDANSLNVLFANDACYRLLGYTPEQVMADRNIFLKILHPEDKELYYSWIEEAITNGRSTKEFRLHHINGDIKTVRGNAIYTKGRPGVPDTLTGIAVDITEHKALETQLIKKSEETSNILETITEAFLSIRPSGFIVYANSACKRILNVHDRELTGQNIFDAIPDLKGTEFEKIFDEYKMMGKGGCFDAYLPSSHKHLSGCTQPYHEILSVFFNDVTENVRTQQELIERNNMLNAVFESIEGSLWLVDTQKCLLAYNEHFREKYKLISGNEPVKGIELYSFLDEKSRTERENQLNKALKGEIGLCYPVYSLNGEEKYFRTVFTPILNEKKTVTGVVGYSIDITAKRMSEYALLESREQLKLFIKNSPAALAMLDTDMNYLLASDKWYKDFNIEPGSVIGKNHYELFPHLPARWKEIHSRCLKGNIEKCEEDTFVRANGTHEWLKWEIHPWYKASGEPGGIIVFTELITEKKLEQLQKERLTNDLLQRNKDLEQFGYIVSHNLRSPLATIVGLSKLFIEEQLNNDEVKELSEGIYESSRCLDDVIRDLNQILQTRRKVGERKENVVFSELVSEIQQISALDQLSTPVIFKTNFEHKNDLLALKSYMRSIFYNLISNSIKYAKPDETTTIEIKSSVKNNKVYLTFKDNGIGIDLERNKDKIFGLYKRFHTGVADGKGIGLYMVKTQVETLGGEINVRSTLGKGTEFIIALPLETEDVLVV